MPNSFHQRCRLALTHPVTLGAVALLTGQRLAPQAPSGSLSGLTGKLSDLAWMVFAPPKLLFALIAPRPQQRQGRANGLPRRLRRHFRSSTAAYNTYRAAARLYYERLHGAEQVRAPARRWYPFESLVIPPAKAAALWVWRSARRSRVAGLRTRLHLYAVVIAALATVATSYDDSPPNAWAMGVLPSGEVLRNDGRGEGSESPDGGLTWVSGQYIDPDISFIRRSVSQPEHRHSQRHICHCGR